MYRRAAHYLWGVSVTMLFLVAAALTAGRFLVPMLADYRSEVASLAGDLLHRSVRIGRVQGIWRGLSPVIKLRDVVITDPDRPDATLALDEVWIGLDLRNVLRGDHLPLKQIDVFGAAVTLIRETDGSFTVAQLGGPAGEGGGLAGLPVIDRISIHDSELVYIDRSTPGAPLRFSDVTATLDDTGAYPVLTGYVLLPAQLGRRVDFAAEVLARRGPPSDWNVRLYLNGQALKLSRKNLRTLVADVDAGGSADVRGWINLKGGRISQVRGDLDVRDLRLHRQVGALRDDYSADHLSGRFGWRRREGGWQFALQDLAIAHPRGVHYGARLAVAQRDYGGREYYAGDAAGVYLDDLVPLVSAAPGIPDELRDRLVRLQPEGQIGSLEAVVHLADGQYGVDGLDVSFRDLGIRPTEGPGFQGLQGSVTVAGNAGAVWLQPGQGVVEDPARFRDPLQFDTLGGEFGWHRWQDGLAITGRALQLENADLALEGDLDLVLPDAAGPQIDLQLDIPRAQVGRLHRYLPARIMPTSGVDWLDHSLVGGDIHAGRVVLQGPLDKLPFDHAEGRLEVTLPVRDAVLDFNDGWTPIHGLAALVNFHGRSMEITGEAGRIRTAELTAVSAVIEDLSHPDLKLTGTVTGDLPVLLAELGDSPLGGQFGGFVDRVSATAAAAVDLDIQVPLHGTDREVGVAGTIHLDGNGLQVRDSDLGFTRIRGTLAFDNKGIKGRNLAATFMHTPVRVDVSTEPGAAGTRIVVRGPLDLVSLLAEQQPELRGILEGRSDWKLQLDIAHMETRSDTPNVDLEISSDLQGIGVDLPEPFGKPAEAVRPLTVSIDRVLHPECEVRVQYTDVLQTALSVRTGDPAPVVRKGRVVLGNAAPPVLPDTQELFIDGNLDRLAPAEWQSLMSRFAGNAGGGLPLQISLAIAHLDLLQQELTGVALHAEGGSAGWQLTLDGPTVKGDLRLEPGATGLDKVTADLQHLRLVPLAEVAENVPAADPDDFPDLDVRIGALEYAGIQFGAVRLVSERVQGGVHVDPLTLKSDMGKLKASGDWQRQDGKPVSRFDIEVTDGKLDKIFREFNYLEEAEGGKLAGTLHAGWSGAPWNFRPDVLDGKLHLVIRDGQLLNVKPGAGRVFGLLSLHTLRRRLSLDFRDLFSKGYAFDRIEGNFTLSDGNAYTSDLLIEGPAARIEISGRVGLADQDYDEMITVVPHVSSSLPIAGALAGGPVVGAALMVADRLIGKELEKRTKFTHRQYTVTGPWADPVYTPVDAEPPPAEDPAPAPVYDMDED